MSGTANINSIVKLLGDNTSKEETRLKAAQELAETFENNINCPGFLDGALRTFLKVLQEGEPHFFSDFNIQQVRMNG
jgi:transformation/transcription domain-associated protein